MHGDRQAALAIIIKDRVIITHTRYIAQVGSG